MKILRVSAILEGHDPDQLEEIEDYFLDMRDSGYKVEISHTNRFYDVKNITEDDIYQYGASGIKHDNNSISMSCSIKLAIDSYDDKIFQKIDSILNRMSNEYICIDYQITTLSKSKKVKGDVDVSNKQYTEIDIELLPKNIIQKIKELDIFNKICNSMKLEELEKGMFTSKYFLKIEPKVEIDIPESFYSKIRRNGSNRLLVRHMTEVSKKISDAYTTKFKQFLDKLNMKLGIELGVKFTYEPDIRPQVRRKQLDIEVKEFSISMSLWVNTSKDSDHCLNIQISFYDERYN